ncbi:MAG: hypothetical protein Q8N22_02440 [bacterium]|nr:hypothetical protein [bacterium]
MCRKITEQGHSISQAHDYGPAIGTVHFLNIKKEPEMLQSCSGCGLITKYNMSLEELLADFTKRGIKFNFVPSRKVNLKVVSKELVLA